MKWNYSGRDVNGKKNKYLLHWEVAVCLKMYLNVFINHILSNFK